MRPGRSSWIKAASVVLCMVAPTTSYGTELRPGVVVDVDGRQLYVMSPSGEVEAIDIDTGNLLWASDQAARPLAVGGGTLVAQADKTASPSALGLVVLNVERGLTVARSSVALPPEVNASIDNSVSSSFVASAGTVGQESYISWEYQEVPVQGIAPGTDDSDPSAIAPPALQMRETTGSVRLNLISGEASNIEPEAVPAAIRETQEAGASALAVSDPTRRLSIDGRHELRSERVADDRVWDKYRWTIFDRTTERQVGELRAHVSQSAFVVTDKLIIFDTGPISRMSEEGLLQQPPMVRAVDLESGGEVWSRPVRDTDYRGSIPP